MNLLFRTSGPTTNVIVTVFVSALLLASCAATANIVDSATTNTSSSARPLSNGTTESVSVAPLAEDSTTLLVQDVSPSVNQSVTTTPSPSSSVVADTLTTSPPSSSDTTTIVPLSTTLSTSSTPNFTAASDKAIANTTLPYILTESSNSTANATTPQTLIYFDPAAGLIINEPTLTQLVSSNGSKLVIKYVNKVNDALSKQTQKFTFKSTTAETGNGTIPKFVAKFLVKNGSGVAEKKFNDFMSDEVRLQYVLNKPN